jgi:2-iminobutanoate/2-iminopropanoate deaminase
VISRIFVAAFLLLPPTLHSQERRYIDPRMPGDTVALPFSAAVLAGNTLYLSGKIGLTAERRIPATAEEEARLVLDDVKSTLQKAGMSMDDLVSVQVFCSDLSHYGVFNRVYRTYFKKEFPARAFIGSGPLLFNARFEVQAVAVRR